MYVKNMQNIVIELSFFFLGKMIKVDFDLLHMDRTRGSICKVDIVVAIDIGTLFSGFAFSLSYEWRKVYNRTWTDGYRTSHKTPTCLLLKRDLSESFFGYEAENKFTELSPEDRLNSYLYFQHFGGILHRDIVRYLCLILFLSSFLKQCLSKIDNYWLYDIWHVL